MTASSRTNWLDRIDVLLQYAPLVTGCAIMLYGIVHLDAELRLAKRIVRQAVQMEEASQAVIQNVHESIVRIEKLAADPESKELLAHYHVSFVRDGNLLGLALNTVYVPYPYTKHSTLTGRYPEIIYSSILSAVSFCAGSLIVGILMIAFGGSIVRRLCEPKRESKEAERVYLRPRSAQ